jgi:hypothetical protein
MNVWLSTYTNSGALFDFNDIGLQETKLTQDPTVHICLFLIRRTGSRLLEPPIPCPNATVPGFDDVNIFTKQIDLFPLEIFLLLGFFIPL